ncbi:MAG TPA: EamA family transporter [Candidatus Cybelea sp.]|jgi:drug/metabolite transporter (DMT)-like permease
MTRRTAALPWIALIAVYFLWGSTYLGIRVAVETIPPYLMTGTRYLIAGVLLFALQWAFAREKPSLPTRAEMIQISIIAVALLTIGNGLLCIAEQRVESGTAALLIASSPIFMVLLDALRMRKAPSFTAMAGILVGTIGIVALVGKSPARSDALMAGLILFSSFAWAAGSVYARGTTHHPLTASLEMIVGGALSVGVGLAIGESSHVHPGAIAPESLWGMLWLIVGGAMIGYSAFAYAVRTLPTPTVATYGYVNPVVAVILGAIILREPVTWRLLAGGAAVIASVVLILLGNRQVSEEAQAAVSS